MEVEILVIKHLHVVCVNCQKQTTVLPYLIEDGRTAVYHHGLFINEGEQKGRIMG